MSENLMPGAAGDRGGTTSDDARVRRAIELRDAHEDPERLSASAVRAALIEHQTVLRLLLDVLDDVATGDARRQAEEDALAALPFDTDLAAAIYAEIPGEHHDAGRAVAEFLATDQMSGAAGRHVLGWLKAARQAGAREGLKGLEPTLYTALRDALRYRRGGTASRDTGKNEAQIGLYRALANELGMPFPPEGRRGSGAAKAAAGAGLTGRHRAVLAYAVYEATDSLTDRDPCRACAASQSGQCGQHEAWERLRAVFAAVGAELGLQAPENPVDPAVVLHVIEIGEQP